MRFTVDWTRTAEEQLASTWIGAGQRQAITRVIDRIEKLLRNDPRGKSIPLPGRFYKLNAPPLQFLFEINDDDRWVTVVSVRRIPKDPIS